METLGGKWRLREIGKVLQEWEQEGERMGGRKGDKHFEDAVDDKCVSQ